MGVVAETVGAGPGTAAVVGAGAVAGVGAEAGARASPEGGGGASPDEGAVAGAKAEAEGPTATTVVGTRVEIDSGGGWVEGGGWVDGGGGVAGGGSTLPPGPAPRHMQAFMLAACFLSS